MPLLLDDTVTVSEYVPAVSPVFGTTVKVAMLLVPVVEVMEIEDGDSEKLLLTVPPESAIVNAPAGWFPVFVTVTDLALCAP